jgi:hypothetical protein
MKCRLLRLPFRFIRGGRPVSPNVSGGEKWFSARDRRFVET